LVAMNEIINIQNDLAQFALDRDWQKYHTLPNLAKAISIEASELLEHFLWEDKLGYEEEIADVLIYCLRFCAIAGIDPIEAIREKMAINADKYPKAKGNCQKYSEFS
jgi:NTP pyrophosphatase (non-canonical NTP hydrolase)